MKALLIVSLVVVSNIAIAQKNIDIPLKVREAFARHYTDPKHMKWSAGKGSYEVAFIYHEQHMSVIYAADGATQETDTKIPEVNLPDDARKYAEKKGNISEAAKILMADGAINYKARVNDSDLIFDADGKFLRESKH